jgi:DNA-binding transcriptional LysR family regulator
LFERTRSGLVPTPAGARTLAAAEAMQAAYHQASRDASGLDDRAEGTVRLSVTPGMAAVFIAPALVRLHELHPNIDIELDASNRVSDLARHQADLALRSVRPDSAELVLKKLAKVRWIAAGATQLVERLHPLESWDDAPWITWDRDLAIFPAARWARRHAPRARAILRTSDVPSQLAAARAGLGIALLPEPYVLTEQLAPVRYAKSLQKSTESWPTDELWLVAHRVRRALRRVAAVWDFFAADLQRLTSRIAPTDKRRRGVKN